MSDPAPGTVETSCEQAHQPGQQQAVEEGKDNIARHQQRSDRALQLLHPIMPFVTEELWAKRMPEGERRDSLLMLSEWPSREGLENAEADAEIGWLIKLVTEVRSVRAEMNVPAGAKVPFVIADASAETKARFAAAGDHHM